ncbi:MAG: ferric reductase-like transmembrane domain-containing protein [Bosea sp. (in: a-proteobacteria)]
MVSARSVLIWAAIGVAVAAPIAVAATSPLLAWRTPVYIASGFAGMAALALMLLQPLLAGGYLPGLRARRGRQVHRWVGAALVMMIIAHVGGLWLTSAPDVIDALLFDSPTPFSVWGVVAMWAAFAAALLASIRGPLRLGPRVWRIAHTALALVIVIGSVVHALLVEGTMGPLSKAAFCALVLVATVKVIFDLRSWAMLLRRRSSLTNGS